MVKTILNKNKIGEFTLPNSKPYYGTKVHNVQYWCQDRQLEQNRWHRNRLKHTRMLDMRQNGHCRKMMKGQCFY